MSIRSKLGQTKLAKGAAQWMTDNRGLVVAATALPASFLFERGTRDARRALRAFWRISRETRRAGATCAGTSARMERIGIGAPHVYSEAALADHVHSNVHLQAGLQPHRDQPA